jgi:hypothetical protein
MSEIHIKFNKNYLYSPTKQAIQIAFTATSDVHKLEARFMLLQMKKLKYCSVFFYSLKGDICVRGCKCYFSFRNVNVNYTTQQTACDDTANSLAIIVWIRLDFSAFPHAYEIQPPLPTAQTRLPLAAEGGTHISA